MYSYFTNTDFKRSFTNFSPREQFMELINFLKELKKDPLYFPSCWLEDQQPEPKFSLRELDVIESIKEIGYLPKFTKENDRISCIIHTSFGSDFSRTQLLERHKDIFSYKEIGAVHFREGRIQVTFYNPLLDKDIKSKTLFNMSNYGSVSFRL